MAAFLGRLRRRIGFRGATLIFFALVDTVYALSLASPPAAARKSPSVAWVELILPLPVWALLWAAVGATCLALAFTRRDRVAFTAAVVLKFGWAMVFLGGWLLADLDRGWVSAVVWFGFAAWAWLTSYWPEPPHMVVDLPERR